MAVKSGMMELAPPCSISSSGASSHGVSPSSRPVVRASSTSFSLNRYTAAHRTSRRLFLVPTIALPLLFHTRNCYSSTFEDFVDPAEQALVETLDARDSLMELCEDMKSFTRTTVSNADLLNPRRALGEIYESLETSLPKVAEQFELEEDTVQELLESIACAQDVFIRSCFTTNPSSGLYNCSKFLQLACGQMDEMLEQVPIKTLQAMQLLRGIRPVA